MRVIALISLLFGLTLQMLLDGQTFTHAVLGISCGAAAILFGLASSRKDSADSTRRWEGRIMAGLGLVLAVICVEQLPSAYRFQTKFNERSKRARAASMPEVAPSAAPVVDEPLPPVHPVYGAARKTIGLDISRDTIVSQPTHLEEALRDLTGNYNTPTALPAAPLRRNLQVDETELQWSGGGYFYGYLYFCAPNSRLPLWEFAPCPKASLPDVTSEDLSARFVAYRDKTNGVAVFGTNWMRESNGIRVSQGQVILARLASDRAQVYALEFARQSPTNAVVFFIKIPQ
jgi:hypothetical protein